MGEEENLTTPLQIAKTAIYLPAIAVTASGAQVFKRQAEGEPPPHLMIHPFTYFIGHGKKAASYEEALQKLEPMEKGLEGLTHKTDALAQYWLEADTSLQDIYSRVEELREDDMLQMRIQGLHRDWKEIADIYQAEKWSYVLLIIKDSRTYPCSADYAFEQPLTNLRPSSAEFG
jgi:hypothetical protein